MAPKYDTLIADFLSANPAVAPVHVCQDAQRIAKFTRYGNVGLYRSGVIYVARQSCTLPGRGYSWPCHRSDRTEIGVLAHELGHHVHMSRPDAGRLARAFPRKIERVSSYEPNAREAIAETFRLYCLNPDLLRTGRPNRYAFFASEFGLTRIEDRPWREVLGDAPPRIILAAERWLEPSKKQPTQFNLSL